MGLFDTFKLQVDAEITDKTDLSSIEPADVGTKFKELADLIEAPLTDINGFSSSDADPSGGSNGDVHIKYGVSPLEVYQLIEGVWTQTGELEFPGNIVNEDLTADQTTATLLTAYPNAPVGQMVICPNISSGPVAYVKINSSLWMNFPLGTINAS